MKKLHVCIKESILLLLLLGAIGCADSASVLKEEQSTLQETQRQDILMEDKETNISDGELSIPESQVQGQENLIKDESMKEKEVGDIGENTDLEENVETENTPEILNFVDVFGEEYQVQINENVEKHTYIPDCFQLNDGKMSYVGDDRYTYRLGIDVSHHQGTVDWEKVKAAGYEFAFLRIGYRGYGQEGKVCEDREFVNNIKNAKAAGIDVGVYFFAQAINEEEALEEAEFVLETLAGEDLELPIVYDPESILDEKARTDDVSGEQFTKNTIVFCNRIEDAGYEPMVYSNMLWEAYKLDLEQLSEYPIWYADYEKLPQTPYHFEFWQYSNTGKVDGVSTNTDLNIQMIPQ